jgi:DNA-binding phage protein
VLAGLSKASFGVQKREISSDQSSRANSHDLIAHLNRVLSLQDPMTFQKTLLEFAHGHFELKQIANLTGARRETVWRYRTGAARAPFGTIVKIVALLGAKVVIVAN